MSSEEKHYDIYEQYNFLRNVSAIVDYLPQEVLYEQLAEEASELAQAALKKARKLQKCNPTPKTNDEIDGSIDEEVSDIFLVLIALNRHVDFDICMAKAERWVNRLKDRDEN